MTGIQFPQKNTSIMAFRGELDTRIIIESMLAHVVSASSEALELIGFYGNLSLRDLDNDDILEQLCWIVYSSGFRYDIIKKYWPSLTHAYHGFRVEEVAALSSDPVHGASRICEESGFRNLSKAEWCIFNARRILEIDERERASGGLKGYLVRLSNWSPAELVALTPEIRRELGFKGIGELTVFHLLKNVGIDIFKPDIHVRRILSKLGLVQSQFAEVSDICKAMQYLSSMSLIRIGELDTLLFCYGRLTGDDVDLVLDRVAALRIS